MKTRSRAKRGHLAAALVLAGLAAYPSSADAEEALRVRDATVDFVVDAATTLRVQADLEVGGGAAGKPSEAFFVRVDRSTMSQAGLGDAYAQLTRAFPDLCGRDSCEFEFSRRTNTSYSYSLNGVTAAVYEVAPGNVDYKYVNIRRVA